MPPDGSIFVGGGIQLKAVTRDATGNVLSGRTLAWQSSHPEIATVDANGLVAGVAPGGPVTMTATSEGQSSVALITVHSAPIDPPQSALLYTTLDDAGSVANPVTGSGVGALIETTPPNDFVAGHVANGLRMDAIAERVLFPQLSGSTQNVELDRGTVEFWIQPLFDHDDGQKYTFFGNGQWLSPGSFHVGVHNTSNGNSMFLILWDRDLNRTENNVLVDDFSWNAGDWVQLRVTWDWSVPAGVQNVHVYLDGIEAPLSPSPNGSVSTGPRDTPAESASNFLYLGSRDTTGGIISSAIYDELRIWRVPLSP